MSSHEFPRLPLFWLMAVVALLSACGTTLPTPVLVNWTLVASSSALPLARDLAGAYQAAYPNVTIDLVEVANSLAAAETVRTEKADAALLTGLPQDDLPPLRATQVATDAVALVVNPANPVDNLSIEQLQDIFAGKVRDWSEVGAGAGAIDLVSREAGSGVRTAFEKAVMQGRPIGSIALLAPGHRQVVEQVAGNRHAIGYLPAGWLDEQVKAVAIGGVGPERIAQQAPGYPLQLPIYLTTAETAAPDVARFVAFVASSAGRKVAAKRYWPAPR